MGNKHSRDGDVWKMQKSGGDFRLKYRSWRTGEIVEANTEPKTSAPPTPVTPKSSDANLLKRAVMASAPPRSMSDFQLLKKSNLEEKEEAEAALDLWLQPSPSPMPTPTVFPPSSQTSPVSSPKEAAKKPISVADLMIDELCSSVTDELVGPEFTSVVSAPLSASPSQDVPNSVQLVPATPPPETKLVVNHLYRPVWSKVKAHLSALPKWYRSNTPPREMAFHIRTLLKARRKGDYGVVVAPFENERIILVCARDRRQLLDAITRNMSSRASVREATIVTTRDGFALDRFVLEEGITLDASWAQKLQRDIETVLAHAPPARVSSSATSSFSKLDLADASLEVPFQEIRLMRLLGAGRSGKTYLAELNGTRIAAKVMNVKDEAQSSSRSTLEEFRRELHVVSKLGHPNIVAFLGASVRPPRFVLLFELCEGDVASLLKQKDRKFSALQFMLDIANGLAYLHSLAIIHRDVKPENLMQDREGRVKLADFGLSCYVSPSSSSRELSAETGTYRYMAPEVMRHEHYSVPVDVYSFALVCYSLLTRRVPFEEWTPLQAAMAVARQNKRPKLAGLPLPPELGELIRECWAATPTSRPDFPVVISRLTHIRASLNHKMTKLLDWGNHDKKRALSDLL